MRYRLVRALAVFALLLGLMPATPAGPARAAAAPSSSSGGLAVTTVDPSGSTLTHACAELWTDDGSGARGTLVVDTQRCDRPRDPTGKEGPEDGYVDGSLGWAGLAAGRYIVHETFPPALLATSASFELAPDTAVMVRSDALARLELVHRPISAITIHKTDTSGRPLPGACFSLDGGARAIFARCDGPSPAGSGIPGDGKADGLVMFTGLTPDGKPRTYLLVEAHAPAGYAPAANQQVVADPASPTELTLVNMTGPKGADGGLAVTTVDPSGSTLTHACAELWTDDGSGARGTLVVDTQRCDRPRDPTGKEGPEDGYVDGSLGWAGLAAGRYIVHETFPPALLATSASFELAPDTAVMVRSDALARLELVHRPISAITIHKTDTSGRPLPGACFSLDGGARAIFARCDGPSPAGSGIPGDGKADGLVMFTGLTPDGKPRTYLLVEAHAPAGYAPAANQQVVADPASPTELTLVNMTGPKGADGGLAVTTVDPSGSTLTHACAELWTDDGSGARGTLVVDTQRCDRPRDPTGKEGPEDGYVDGSLGWAGLAAGRYIVHETFPPALLATSASFELAPDTAVMVRSDALARLELVHRPISAITIHKTDTSGRPLPGACFSLDGGARAIFARCDGPSPAGSGIPGDGKADGLVMFTGLTPDGKPRTYLLVEAHAPAGYAPAANQQVVADPASPTELTLVNTTGPKGADGAGGGGSTGGGITITSLVLEIDSRIEFQLLNATPVANGLTIAKGSVELVQAGGSDAWRGKGTVDATTTSGTAACPSIHVEGTGTYDWVVRSATIGPDLDSGALVVNMDSGPINEAPDAFTMDACTVTFPGTLNTWESLFFDVHRPDFLNGGDGFRVDGWELTSRDAWTTGGTIAEAHWSGDCLTAYLVDCSEATTFRLIATLEVVAASPGPGTGGGGLSTAGPSSPDGAAEASPGPSGAGGFGPSGPVAACDGLLACLSGTTVVLIGVAILALLGGLAWLLFGRNPAPAWPQKFQATDLNASANEIPMSPIDLGEESIIGQLSPDKLPLDASLDKLPLDASLEKVPPDASTLTDPGGDIKLGDVKFGDIKLTESLDTTLGGELPPPPGSGLPGGT